jgi:DNA-binding MarR family transcriptional regulator
MIDKDYVEAISLIERAHRSFLAVIKLELDDLEVRDINNVQAMMLFNIGDARMTVGELITRGCYLGSNVSYNLKKLIGYEYIVQERSTYDRRATHVRLSDKGRSLRDQLSSMHQRHMEMLKETMISVEGLDALVTSLRQLERFLVQTKGLSSAPIQRAS